jgi:molybdenum cofactor cytidylyltransferase
MRRDIAAVILAAGAGRRLGTVAKATLELVPGTSFLSAIASRVARESAVVVVGEPHRAAVEAEAASLGLAVALNPDPSRGMASSVEVGFNHVISRCADAVAALLWPVDHPWVGSSAIDSLVDRARVDRIVVPTTGGRGGHPTLFGRDLWPELARCASEPDGARTVVRADPARVDRVAVDDEAVARDVDVPEDLPA